MGLATSISGVRQLVASVIERLGWADKDPVTLV